MSLSRFWAKVQRGDPSGCWLWVGSQVEGYGTFRATDKVVRAHRFAYETFIGPVPVGLELDHLCRNTCCVNPAHLEPVTHRENVLRGAGPTAVNAQKSRCRQGHEYSPEVTKGRTGRRCVTCRRIRVLNLRTCPRCGASITQSNIVRHQRNSLCRSELPA